MKMSSSNFDKLSFDSHIFLQSIKDENNRDERLAAFLAESESREIKVPEFENGLQWLNCSEALTFEKHLRGKIVVLDFFTYCCINCMHVLPDLRALEEKFSAEDGVVVVGIHSAKFDNERVVENIKEAVLRYRIQHAVVNDSEAALWNQMKIQCWPTFVIVGPDGKCLLYMVGEGHRQTLLDFVSCAVAFYEKNGKLQNHQLPIKAMQETMNKHCLKYPGKVCTIGDEFAIADSANNRILIVTKDGVVKRTIGNFRHGLKDGSFEESRFHSPQGVAYFNGSLYVADTENHCIRKIDLERNIVSRIAGTGKQGTDKEGGNKGPKQEISSPWDLSIGPAPGSPTSDAQNVLYIAMAGIHQIWCLFLEDGIWLRKSIQPSATCLRFAGSGNEENRNNSYPHKAAFAQPSGLSIATVNEKRFIYVADSESSSIRSIELTNGAVKACVGGEKDPMNLFSYGDKDGKGVEAKLQHPLGVVWNEADGKLYVADSYNHKIKVIDPKSNTCSTLAGTGEPGLLDGPCLKAQFNEPGGIDVCEGGRTLVVADTNNHAIRKIDLQRMTVTELRILHPDDVDAVSITKPKTDSKVKAKRKLLPKNAPVFQVESAHANLDLQVTMQISIKLPENCHFTDEAQSKFAVSYEVDGNETSLDLDDDNIGSTGVIDITANIEKHNRRSVHLKIELLVYFCSPQGLCLMKNAVLKQTLMHDELSKGNTLLTYEHIFIL